MDGFRKLSREMREEMLKDAKDISRGMAFRVAREKAEQGDLDEYIRFLSESMKVVRPEPTRRLTPDFRL